MNETDITTLGSGQLARLFAVTPRRERTGRGGPDETTVAAPAAVSRRGLPFDEPGPFAPGDTFDDHEIVEELGRGGMCIVYEAVAMKLNCPVALKTLRPSLAENESVVKRFLREAILAANLDHPNILPVFHSGHNPPAPPYFTMRYVHGRTVRDEVAFRGGPLDPPAAVRTAFEVAAALDYAHARSILHRDVTPRNIIYQDVEDDAPRVRLIDFGIARDITGTLSEVTETDGIILGAPLYMSPEQHLGKDLDARTDIYSLGMTLYYMLTGATAYHARNRTDLVAKIIETAPEPPSIRNPAVGAGLDRVVMKTIEPDRERRYTSCAALADALHNCAAAPGAITDRTTVIMPREPTGRRPRRMLVAAAAAVLLAAGFAAWLAIRGGGGEESGATPQPARVAHEGMSITVNPAKDTLDPAADNMPSLPLDRASTYHVSVSGTVDFGGGTTVSAVYLYGAGAGADFCAVAGSGHAVTVTGATRLYAFLADNGVRADRDNRGSLTLTVQKTGGYNARVLRVDALKNAWDMEAEMIPRLSLDPGAAYRVRIAQPAPDAAAVDPVYLYGAGNAFMGVAEPGTAVTIRGATELYGFRARTRPVDKDAGAVTLTARRLKETAGAGAAARDEPAPPARPELAWVYQPEPGRSFDAPNAIRGRTRLAADGEHAGMYVFARGKGLVPSAGAEMKVVDFRVAAEEGAMKIIRDCPDETGGILTRSADDAFEASRPPETGYESFFRGDLAPGTVLFFRCGDGGRAKVTVTGE